MALTYEGILFLVPSLQERSDNQRIDEYIGSPLSGARRQLSTNFQQNHIFHPPGLLNQQTVRLVAPIKPQRNWILSRQIKPNKLSSTYVRRKIVPLISQNVNFNIPHHKYKYFGWFKIHEIYPKYSKWFFILIKTIFVLSLTISTPLVKNTCNMEMVDFIFKRYLYIT